MNKTEDIWTKYHKKLANFIRKRVTHNEVDEILQNVFLKIHTNISSLKENDKLESWIFMITRNAIVDYYRSKRPEDDLPAWIEQPEIDEADNVRKELSKCMRPMIDDLPEKYRLPLVLSELEGKTQKEVAEKENLSLSGAKSRVQRGRGLLKTMFQDCCEFEINTNNQLVSYEPKKKDCKKC